MYVVASSAASERAASERCSTLISLLTIGDQPRATYVGLYIPGPCLPACRWSSKLLLCAAAREPALSFRIVPPMHTNGVHALPCCGLATRMRRPGVARGTFACGADGIILYAGWNKQSGTRLLAVQWPSISSL